jgi:Ca2+-binding EF-hand superfamily protein
MAAAGRLRSKRLSNFKAEKERLRRELSDKESADMEVWFAEHDEDHDNKFDRKELKHLFKFIEPEHALTTAAENFMLEKINDVKEISRENIIIIVKKYRHYIKQWDKLNDLFAKYDTNNNGVLENSEIRQLMIDKAGGVVNVSNRVEVTDEDVDYVMSVADPEQEAHGGVDREHLMTAIGQWYQLASEKREKKRQAKKSTFCILL